MSLSAKGWLVFPLILMSFQVFSQEVAPYSRFGLGEVTSPNFTAAKGLGGLAAGYREPLQINFLNPASYSNIQLTTLEAGFNFIHKSIIDGSTQQNYKTGNGFVDYVALGFPAGKRGGLSVGLIPYSKMNYNFHEVRTDSAIGEIEKSYEGSGRLYQLYVGGACRFPKIDTTVNSFSIGLNAAYVFGKFSKLDTFLFPDASTYDNKISSLINVSSLALNIGFQYKRKLEKDLSVTIGAYSHFPVFSSSTKEEVWERLIFSRVVDTVSQSSLKDESITVPVEIGVGATTGKSNKWLAGLDFNYKVWSGIPSFSPSATMKDSWEIRAGGEIKPNVLSSNVLKRTAYRLGIYYNSGNLQINDQDISEYGITFGFGIPIKSAFARLHFTMDIGQRGTLNDDLVKETFYRAFIGFTLNDNWFIKRKYD